MTQTTAPEPATAMKVLKLAKEDQPFLPGRRKTMRYRELGATEATAGAMRAQVMSTFGPQGPNGWHKHHCEAQFLYVLSGEIHLSFAPGNIVHMVAGDSITIPGGVVHQELGATDGAEILEVSIPADMGTEAADVPTSLLQPHRTTP